MIAWVLLARSLSACRAVNRGGHGSGTFALFVDRIQPAVDDFACSVWKHAQHRLRRRILFGDSGIKFHLRRKQPRRVTGQAVGGTLAWAAANGSTGQFQLHNRADEPEIGGGTNYRQRALPRTIYDGSRKILGVKNVHQIRLEVIENFLERGSHSRMQILLLKRVSTQSQRLAQNMHPADLLREHMLFGLSAPDACLALASRSGGSAVTTCTS